jgi:hypothetical protein
MTPLLMVIQCILVPMSSIEGSYSVHFAKGITGFTHPDLPALKLACSVLNALESYLWKSIRGAGLAYSANVEVDEEAGLVGFSVYRVSFGLLAEVPPCSDTAGASMTGLEIVKSRFLVTSRKGSARQHHMTSKLTLYRVQMLCSPTKKQARS